MQKITRVLAMGLFSGAFFLAGVPQARAGIHVGIGIGGGNPGYYGPSGPGYYSPRYWVPGYWARRGPERIWVPGYWAYNPDPSYGPTVFIGGGGYWGGHGGHGYHGGHGGGHHH